MDSGSAIPPGAQYPGLFNPGTDEYTADAQVLGWLANASIDIGSWHCFTPYIGGGVGFAQISVGGFHDVNLPNFGVALRPTTHSEDNFAWAVYAGCL